MNDLVKALKEWLRATVLDSASARLSSSHARGDADGGMRASGEKVHCGTTTLAGWSDAADGEQTAEGRRRLGQMIGRVSSTHQGPRHLFQWATKIPKKMVKRSLGG